jgi:hypothetical protein
VLYLDFTPRLATERADSAEIRLDKIQQLIQASKYSIHDLSRCQSSRKAEYARLNMPFELGIDYGCRRFCGDGRNEKQFLILEKERYRYQAAISDLSGCDIQAHKDDFQTAMRKVRNWLVTVAGAPPLAPAEIKSKYEDFQQWRYEKLLGEGFSEDDIKDYPTPELLSSMTTWISSGKPL